MKLKKIGIITSGGDVPGLNAALHAIVLAANNRGLEVIGIHDGYEGLIDGFFEPLSFNTVRNIMDEGGTILRTSRSKRFTLPSWRKKAYKGLVQAGIDGLIIIGGNGSLMGAATFASEFDIPVIGIPKTIDNDVFGTDFAIGFDTATNTIVEAIDKINDTADSTSRTFIVEVMGRKAGFLALHGGIAGGAGAIIVPEIKPDLNKLMTRIEHNQHIRNKSMIIVMTENCLPKGAEGLKKQIDKKFPQADCRITVLGHIQRGGSPTVFDRNLASLLGLTAVKALLNGKKGVMIGYVSNKIKQISLGEVSGKPHPLNNLLLEVANEFSVLI